jgi:hypothetical protein
LYAVKPWPALLPLLLPACAASVVPPASTVAATESRPDFIPAEVRSDLEKSARTKFGAALTDQALAAPTFLLAKHYMGLPPPAILQPDGTYSFAEPPMSMLIRRDGQWLAARAGLGFVPVAAEKASAIDLLLRNDRLWSEPDHGRPTCTDAGASLLWLRTAGRRAVTRKGACGATQLTEKLVLQALET